MKKIFLLIIISLTIASFSKTRISGQAIPPEVDKQKVMSAIDKGRNFLLTYLASVPGPVAIRFRGKDHPGQSADEFVLYTLAHTNVDQNSNAFRMLLNRVIDKEFTQTYQVAPLAMALGALDSKKYQHKIAQCAQYLVDQQCRNGQWGYGHPMKDKPEFAPEVAPSESKPGQTQALRVIEIKRRGRATEKSGDNSNTQYALLGLRACMDANVSIPQKTFQAAGKWLLQSQNPDGGWGYYGSGKRDKSYRSMSAGCLSVLVICRHYLGKDYKKNTRIRRGLKWLAEHFTVTTHPHTTWYHFYYLYALERAGMLYGTETFGDHKWYKEGADYLLSKQEAKGSWLPYGLSMSGNYTDMVETCFALLFLCRATKAIISK